MFKTAERKARPFMYAFLIFCGLYSFSYGAFKELNLLSIILTIIYIGFSVPVGWGIHLFMNWYFNRFNWDEQCIIIEYRILKRVLQSIGISILYFYLQVGIMFLFFPSFITFQFNGVPLFLPFFAANCFLVIWVYKEFIWRKFSEMTVNESVNKKKSW